MAATLMGACLIATPCEGASKKTRQCDTFKVPDSQLDLAPPSGYVDICRRDAALCEKLTAGYPSSTRTLAYFVTSTEWKQRNAGRQSRFSRYLIAQAALGTPASQFPQLKQYIQSRQGDLPDNSAVPSALETSGRASLGILEDTDDAIVTGVISRLRLPAPLDQEIVLAASNTAMIMRGQLLSLYAYVDITKDLKPDPMRTLTSTWLSCIRTANKAVPDKPHKSKRRKANKS